MNQSVDNYFINGCERCPLGGTPNCKVHSWTTELTLLRSIVLDCGIREEAKWGVPCYTFQNKNVLLITAFKDYCSISFFKGALIHDAKKILEKPGPNSQAARLLKFTNVQRIKEIEADIKAYIYEAIEVEKAGFTIDYKKRPEPIPEELQIRFDEDPVLKSAFEALTPGRQRGYILFFSAAKQSKTREARIDKYAGQILNGIGLHDKYVSRRR